MQPNVTFVLKCIAGDRLDQSLTFNSRQELRLWLDRCDFHQQLCEQLGQLNQDIHLLQDKDGNSYVETSEHGVSRTIKLKLEGNFVVITTSNDLVVPAGAVNNVRMCKSVIDIARFVNIEYSRFNMEHLVSAIMTGTVTNINCREFYVVYMDRAWNLRIEPNDVDTILIDLNDATLLPQRYSLGTLLANLREVNNKIIARIYHIPA